MVSWLMSLFYQLKDAKKAQSAQRITILRDFAPSWRALRPGLNEYFYFLGGVYHQVRNTVVLFIDYILKILYHYIYW